MSDSNRVQLRIAKESDLNVQAPGPYKPLRITSESMVPEIENITSSELRADRMISDIIQVSRSNSGGFAFELSPGTFDDLIEGAMFSTWGSGGTNTIKNGVTKHSYTIEKALLDIDQYFLFTGNVVSSWSLNLATSAIATGSFEFLGCSAILTQTANTGTLATGSTSSIMNCMVNVGTLQEGSYGGTLTPLTGIYVQEMSFTVNNNLRTIMGIGYDTVQDISAGKMDVTGTFNAHFANARLFDKFLASTAVVLGFTITVGAKSYTFTFPKVKFSTESVVSGGQDQDVVENMTWQALVDPTTSAQMVVDRAGY